MDPVSPLLTAIIELAKGAGGYAIVICLLMWLYIGERKERKELSDQVLELAKNASNSASTFAEILDKAQKRHD